MPAVVDDQLAGRHATKWFSRLRFSRRQSLACMGEPPDGRALLVGVIGDFGFDSRGHRGRKYGRRPLRPRAGIGPLRTKPPVCLPEATGQAEQNLLCLLVAYSVQYPD